MIFLLIGLLGACAVRPAHALDPNRAITQALLRKWQVPQGLPQATILRIIQTADRYLWLGTQSGAFRFDGIRFVPLTGTPDLPLDRLWIQDLCEDHDQNLWIATDDAGLIRHRNGAIQRFGLAEGLPSLNVQRLLVDRRGTLWIGTDRGLARWSNDRISIPAELESAEPLDVRALAEDEKGFIWFGGAGPGLGIWNGTTLDSRFLTSLPAGESVNALCRGKEGAIWVGTSAGLIRIRDGEQRLVTRADGLADDAIKSLTPAADGTLWVGTRDGISRIHDKKIETFRARDGLSQSMVHTICEDHEGGVWVGTKHGLNQLIDRRTIPLTTSEGLPGNDTGPILQDRSGVIWIGTLGQGLARYDDGRFGTISKREGLPSETILALVEGEPGVLWIGTDKGLVRMHDGRPAQVLTTANGLPSNVMRSLCFDREGAVWVGTDAGLVSIAADGRVRPQAGSGSHSAVRTLIEYGESGVLAATEEGLFHCRPAESVPYAVDDRALRSVDAFCLDASGNLWIGTRGGGVGLLRDGKARFFTIKEGLFDNDVSGIVADDEDRLWMACSRGIFFVRRTELLQCAAGETSRFTSIPFSPTDAQRTVECQNDVQPVVWKMRDKRLWFSTIRGVTIIDSDHILRRLPAYPVSVEEVRVNGEDVQPARSLELPAGSANVSFRYTALTFASPGRLLFEHMLDGFDKTWIDAGTRREAFYTNLAPGNYRFRVRARMPDGAWNESVAPVALAIPPRFYQTGWFASVSIAALALAIWGLFQLRVLRVRAHLNGVLAERGRIARELHDTLIQGFSGVTMQMQALSARLARSPEKSNLDEIIQDAGTCLREARRSVGGLRDSAQGGMGFVAALSQAARQLTETKDIRLRLDLPADSVNLPVDVEYNLLRIMQEAISNAVRHSGARTIEVALHASAGSMNLTVKDDGIGFSVADVEMNRPGHYGLIGMRERASQIHAALNLESVPGTGTTIRLNVPVPGDDLERAE